MGKQSCTLASVIPVQTSLDKAKRNRVHVCHSVCKWDVHHYCRQKERKHNEGT